MNLLTLLLGWLIAKTIRIVPANQGSPPSPVSPPPAGGGRRTTPTRTPRTTPSTPRGSTVPASFTAPWPQVVPAGLPTFPGGDWVPYSPPPGDVVSRASALLTQLWRGGVGTFKVEKLGARWVAFRATDFPGGKRGVVAYRLRDPSADATATPEPFTRTSAPTQLASTRSSVALPTLVKGSTGDDVKLVQTRLNVTPTGYYGDMTFDAVKAFQARNGLVADGKVGPNTWAVLLGGAA